MVLFFQTSCYVKAQHPSASDNAIEALKEAQSSAWVDSLFNTLSTEQKIAQLFWIDAKAENDVVDMNRVRNWVKEYQPGGVLFSKSDVSKMLKFEVELQKLSKTPLIFSMDAEWGGAMRLPELHPFPYQMTLGAIQKDSLIYDMGQKVAQQLKMLGISVNLAPVADVNSNPANPVIGFRSFGEDKNRVAQKAMQYAMGMQSQYVGAVAKHFPGHGDTDMDSHFSLPKVKYNKARFDSVDFVPFKTLIDSGILGVMSAHLEVPELDSVKGRPSSLSPIVLKDILRKELGFEGFIITDAMNMKGVKVAGQPGEVDALALSAGNDIAEYTENLPASILAVKKAIDNGRLLPSELDAKCRKSLALKYWCGAHQPQLSFADSMVQKANCYDSTIVNLYLNAFTQLSGHNSIPFQHKEKKIGVLTIGSDKATLLANELSKNRTISSFVLTYESTAEQILAVEKELSKMDYYVINFVDCEKYKKIANKLLPIKKSMAKWMSADNAITLLMGNPYRIAQYPGMNEAKNLIVGYEDRVLSHKAMAQFLISNRQAQGVLPVSVMNFKSVK